jgi:hypothetical protein
MNGMEAPGMKLIPKANGMAFAPYLTEPVARRLQPIRTGVALASDPIQEFGQERRNDD